jgi:hypothetical protein
MSFEPEVKRALVVQPLKAVQIRVASNADAEIVERMSIPFVESGCRRQLCGIGRSLRNPGIPLLPFDWLLGTKTLYDKADRRVPVSNLHLGSAAGNLEIAHEYCYT